MSFVRYGIMNSYLNDVKCWNNKGIDVWKLENWLFLNKIFFYVSEILKTDSILKLCFSIYMGKNTHAYFLKDLLRSRFLVFFHKYLSQFSAVGNNVPAGIYLLKFSIGNTKARCEKLTIKTRFYWRLGTSKCRLDYCNLKPSQAARH